MPAKALSRAARRSVAAMLTAAGLTLSPVSIAIAQAPQVPATVKAVASPWMPQIDRVQLQAEESDDVDQQLEQTITQALAKRGITVDPAAPMILSYDTEISGDTTSSAAGSEPTVDQTELGARGNSQEMSVPGDVGPLYGENAPGVMPEQIAIVATPSGAYASESQGFGPPTTVPLGGSGPGGGPNYSLSFTLGLDGSPPVWSGSVQAVLPEQNPESVARVMVTPLVLAIGRSGKSNILMSAPSVTD